MDRKENQIEWVADGKPVRLGLTRFGSGPDMLMLPALSSPPFEVIASKFSPETGSLIIALRGPHHMMNFRPTQSEAEDIAAYIATLKR
jgi:hypothetical protein